MATLVTDEMIQKAAHAGVGRTPWPGANFAPDGRVYYSGFDLRAAIEAIAPMIRNAALEEAAKMAEYAGDTWSGSRDVDVCI